MSLHRLAILIAAAVIAAPSPAWSQKQDDASRTAVSLSGGISQFDLSGTGTAPLGAVRIERPLERWLVAEGGILVTRPRQQFGEITTFIVPEFQLQLQTPNRVAPYVGAGFGRAFDIRSDQFGGTIARVTMSGALGVRAWMSSRAGARAELRVRGIGSGFNGSAVEGTMGWLLRL